MRSRTRWILGAIGAVVVIIVIYALVNIARGPVTAVRTAEVTRGRLEKTVSASGETASQNDVDVFSPTQSTVKRVLVADQQFVSIGQPIVQLDPAPYELARAQANAGIAQADAQEHSTQKQVPTDADFDAAHAAVDAAFQAYLNAKNAFEHPKPTINPVPPPALIPPNKKQLKAQMLSAFAQYEQGLASLAKLDVAADVGPEVNAAEAAQVQSDIAHSQAVHNIQLTTVRAPIAGIVFLNSFSGVGPSRPIQKGQGVSPAQSVCRIIDARHMKFVADVDEADVAGVRRGEDGVVTLDAFGDREFKGKVTRVSVLSKTTQSGGSAFSTDLLISGTTTSMRVGMSGTADIVTARRPEALQIPVEAVTQRNGKDVVFVFDKGIARERDVTLGLSTDVVYEVKSGLKAGEKVITTGLEGLKDGSRVSEQP